MSNYVPIHSIYNKLGGGDDVLVIGTKTVEFEDHIMDLVVYTDRLNRTILIPVENIFFITVADFLKKYRFGFNTSSDWKSIKEEIKEKGL